MTDAVYVFDRRTVRAHRDRAAACLSEHDFLVRAVGERLVERLEDVRRRFARVLILGGHGGALRGLIAGRAGDELTVEGDLSPAMARRASGAAGGPVVVADEEWLPFAAGGFDLVLSCLALHWVNDLPGALLQIRQSLRPDGLFLATLIGGESLRELRHSLIEAELAEAGGVGPRVSPFVDVRDAGHLLQRAGFALPVVDADTWTVKYGSALDLMRDLRGMGETNAVAERPRHFTRRSTLLRAAAIYADQFADDEGRVPATFQVLTLTAWAPHESQPQALKPGSAAARLATALGTREHTAGEVAIPKPSNER